MSGMRYYKTRVHSKSPAVTSNEQGLHRSDPKVIEDTRSRSKRTTNDPKYF